MRGVYIYIYGLLENAVHLASLAYGGEATVP